jgi:hypothetical protein
MYAKIRYLDGRESNVSLKDLARYPVARTNTFNESNIESPYHEDSTNIFNEGHIEPLYPWDTTNTFKEGHIVPSHAEVAQREADLLQNSRDNNQEGNIERFNLSDNCDNSVNKTNDIVLNDNEESYESSVPSATYVNSSNSHNLDTARRSSRITKGAPPTRYGETYSH